MYGHSIQNTYRCKKLVMYRLTNITAATESAIPAHLSNRMKLLIAQHTMQHLIQNDPVIKSQHYMIPIHGGHVMVELSSYNQTSLNVVRAPSTSHQQPTFTHVSPLTSTDSGLQTNPVIELSFRSPYLRHNGSCDGS
jgi:hypothetical protein